MVILDEYHVEEAYAMVASAADPHSLLFKHAHAGSCLACIEHLGLESGKTILIAGRLGGDTAHTLHDVEHHALGLEQGSYLSFHLKGDVAGLDMRAISDKDGHFEFGIEFLEHFACYLYTGKDPFLLDNELLASGLTLRDGGEGGVVAVADILGKCESQQVVYELIFGFHIGNVYLCVMKIVLITVGRTSTQYIADAVADFLKRINRYAPMELSVIPDLKSTKSLTPEAQKQAEGVQILGALQGGDHVCLLDERGREMTSREFSCEIERRMVQGLKRLVFVIGGPYGFSSEVYGRADSKLSLSRMTFTHEMVRLFFIEQVYRAMTIMRGEPYHHD